jgi:hypothetical protein
MHRNRILAGSLFMMILFILYPSTHVISAQTMKDTVTNKVNDQSSNMFIKKIKTIGKIGDYLRHPILFVIVSVLFRFQFNRAWLLYELSISRGAFNWIETEFPLVYLRACWLLLSAECWLTFWQHLSYSLDWNWPLDTSN